mmetsp:Transcript_16170/g.37879  ORF Transcript_16170/g.37879 Transcript_16170/m.37879 type:complete len:492 (-) Transcript_16170:125-1600(-)
MFSSSGPEEKRRDPEDGQFRTYAELQQACADKFTEEEIKQYWETQCVAQQVVDARAEHNVAVDPFMTRTQQQEGGRTNLGRNPFMTGGAAVQTTNTQRDPFMTRPEDRPVQSAPGAMEEQLLDVRRDPFMTRLPDQRPAWRPDGQPHWRPVDSMEGPSRREQFEEVALKVRRHWTEVVCRLLGPGDPDRRPSIRNILVLAPWLLFMWVLLLWILLRHYSADTSAMLTGILLAASATLVVLWYMGKRWGPVSFLALGSLCLIAVLAGTTVGQLGWIRYWRQYWWLQTGARTEGNSAATPAGSQVDSAIIGFWDDHFQRTVHGTYVDDLKSAGFKDEYYYCVAPVLSPQSAESTFIRVNYWAVGINCCQRSGSFFCDDSRSYDAGYGIVMLDEGLPCPNCHQREFKAAVSKAEALHGLVSAPGARFIRWVRNPMATEMAMLWKALLFLLVSGLLAFCVFWTLGSLAWYYGMGKRHVVDSVFEGSETARRKGLA